MDWLKRLFRREKIAQDGPQRLDLPAPPPKPPQQPKPTPAADRVPGNFFFFDNELDLEIAGVVHAGRPKRAGNVNGQIRWADFRNDLPDPNRPRVRWIDDPHRGVNQRVLQNPEDVLGAEGMFGDKRMRFERILELGKNTVVYALFCPDHNFRTAYGWNREVFQPGYVVHSPLASEQP